ncbi:MAG: hypothetical protein PHS67_03860 [Sphaerochaetaceae bacterium]|nr:hypothetical protein [Sphaerochaetaceae bacterium]MDD4218973.1 hypothetical protein [Sphaerochaetaceae bacterium]
MTKSKRLLIIVLVGIIMVLLVIPTLSARVVGSATLTLYAYVPAKTSVQVDQTGEIFFTSNYQNVLLNVAQWQDVTWLSVSAL